MPRPGEAENGQQLGHRVHGCHVFFRLCWYFFIESIPRVIISLDIGVCGFTGSCSFSFI